MKKVNKSLVASIYSAIAILILSGCGASSGARAFDLKTVQSKLSRVAPNCKLENVSISKVGKTNGFTNDYYVIQSLLPYRTDFSGVLPNSKKILISYDNSGWNNSPDENVIKWDLNDVADVYACNTNGVPLSNLKTNIQAAWNEVDRYRGEKGNDCTFYKPYTAKNSAKAKVCLAKLKTLKRDGEWVVISTSDKTTPTKFLSTFMSGLKKVYDDNPQDSRDPMAVGPGYILSFSPDYTILSDEQISARNSLWNSIVKSLGATTWDKLDKDAAGFVANYANFTSTEKELAKVIAREPEIIECNTLLKINENTATSSDCGKINVDVFQSDLNTGNCSFLAYWNDKSGSRRIGIFRYCGAFTAGSVHEDSNYKMRVRVSGPESYKTAAGSQSRVLAFTVIGN